MLLYINDKVCQKDGIVINYSKIIKKGNDLYLYVDNSLVQKIGTVTNWNAFKVKGGEILEEIDNPKVLLDNLMNMKLDNAQYLVEKKAILQELMDMKLKLMKGGL